MNAVSDSLVILKRNLIKIVRVPEIIMFALIQPILFVLLFAYVFGSAISLKGGYREFLIAGIFAQTCAQSGSIATGNVIPHARTNIPRISCTTGATSPNRRTLAAKSAPIA